jgi:fumarylpyruvate hydrolase
MTQDLHHEVELVVALASGGENIKVHEAQDLIYGYAVGIDLTRRDLQAEAKKLGRPWDASKTFLHAAPCSELMPGSSMKSVNQAAISLSVNGEIRQSGNLDQMIWKVPEIISRLSECFPLRGGDLIFTGTPAGVGPVQVGDELHAEIEGIGSLRVRVTQ